MAEQTVGKATARGYSYVGTTVSNYEDYRRDERLTRYEQILTGSVRVGPGHSVPVENDGQRYEFRY